MVKLTVVSISFSVLILCAIIDASSIASDESAEVATIRKFNEFMNTHGKSYPTAEEYGKRLEIFKENLKIVEQRNQQEINNGGSGTAHGVTQFSDLSQKEFESRFLNSGSGYRAFGGNRTRRGTGKAGYKNWKAGATAITFKDWTGIYTTPMRDQGQCGSCWAFAAVEQIESDAIRLLGWPASSSGWLSAQQINSCDTQDGGCNGGDPIYAYMYVMSAGGVQSEADYSYTSGNTGATGTCKFDSTKKKVGISSYNLVSTSTNAATIESAMANYVLNVGTLSICLDATQFNSYTSGVMTTCTNSVNHCIQAVGINTGASTPYWIFRNQWGASWGMNGFIWIKYGVNLCRLTDESTYVVPFLINGPGPSPTAKPTLQPASGPVTAVPTPKPAVPTPMPSKVPSTPRPSKMPSSCVVDYTSYLGDGWCDNMGNYNTANCNWDGGDCCPQTCASAYYACGTSTYVCLNPAYSAMPIISPTVAPSTASPSRSPTVSQAPTKVQVPTMAPLSPVYTRRPTKVPVPRTSRPTKQPTTCQAPRQYWIGDGYCDSLTYNNAACNYDGGDCCPQTCVGSICGSNGYNCINPIYNTASPTNQPIVSPPTSQPTPMTAVPTTTEPTAIPGSCTVAGSPFLGDGLCDSTTAGFNTAACNWDGGDCCASTCTSSQNLCGQYPFVCLNPDATDSCSVAGSPLLGNGFCNPGEYNTPGCGYDGGDCCPGTCQAGLTYECGTNTRLSGGYQCFNAGFRLSKAPVPLPTPVPVTRTKRPVSSTCASSVDYIGRVGNGYCNGGNYNSAACGYDGGDCCAATCVSGTFTCPPPSPQNYPNCIDPSVLTRP